MATGWAWLTRDAGEGGTVLAISARGWSPNEPLLPQKFLRYSDADGGRLARQLTARLRAGRVAQRTGLKVEDIVLCQPDSGEMALEVVDQLVRSGVISLIAVDSGAARRERGRDRRGAGCAPAAPRPAAPRRAWRPPASRAPGAGVLGQRARRARMARNSHPAAGAAGCWCLTRGAHATQRLRRSHPCTTVDACACVVAW